MEVVDVLGHQEEIPVQLMFQPRQRDVRGIGRHHPIQQVGAPRVVEPMHEIGIRFKGLRSGDVLRSVVLPQPVGVPESGDSGFGGHARPGENDY